MNGYIKKSDLKDILEGCKSAVQEEVIENEKGKSSPLQYKSRKDFYDGKLKVINVLLNTLGLG